MDWNNVRLNGWKRRDKDYFKILSIDGGGIKGIFPARYLSLLEENIDKPIYEYFDLITGTSTGGIIALALSVGINSKDIVKMYLDNAKNIFKPNNEIGIENIKFNIPLTKSKYSNKGLSRILKEVFKSKKLSDSNAMLCIPSVEHKRAIPKIYKTPHYILKNEFMDEYMYNVALATSAAPLYFPAAVLNEVECRIDGGIWANNPTLVGISEAISLNNDIKDIKILSIGTGKNTYTVNDKIAINSSLVSWNIRIIDFIMSTQDNATAYIAKNLIGKDNMKRINFTGRRKLYMDCIDEQEIKELLFEANQCFNKTGYDVKKAFLNYK